MEHIRWKVYNYALIGSTSPYSSGTTGIWTSFNNEELTMTSISFFSTNKKVLIFNITGPRDVNEMLNLINQKVKFTEAIFTQNILSISAQATGTTPFL